MEEQHFVGLSLSKNEPGISPYPIENKIIVDLLQGIARGLQKLSSLTSVSTALEYYCK